MNTTRESERDRGEERENGIQIAQNLLRLAKKKNKIMQKKKSKDECSKQKNKDKFVYF